MSSKMLSPKTTVDAKTTRTAGVLGSILNAPKTEITYCNNAEVNLAGNQPSGQKGFTAQLDIL